MKSDTMFKNPMLNRFIIEQLVKKSVDFHGLEFKELIGIIYRTVKASFECRNADS
jgi:hypothetical protein